MRRGSTGSSPYPHASTGANGAENVHGTPTLPRLDCELVRNFDVKPKTLYRPRTHGAVVLAVIISLSCARSPGGPETAPISLDRLNARKPPSNIVLHRIGYPGELLFEDPVFFAETWSFEGRLLPSVLGGRRGTLVGASV